MYLYDKGLASSTYELLQLNNKNTNPIKNFFKIDKRFEQTLHQRMMNKHERRCSIILVIKRTQMKAIISYYHTATKMIKMKKTNNTNSENVE